MTDKTVIVLPTEHFPKLRQASRIAFHLPLWLGRMMIADAVPQKIRVRLAATSAYVLLPISLLTRKKWGVIGLADDAILALTTLEAVFSEVPKDVQRDLWRGRPEDLETLERWSGAVYIYMGQMPHQIAQTLRNLRARRQTTPPPS